MPTTTMWIMITSSSTAIKNKKLPTILKILLKKQFQVLCLSQDYFQSCGGFSTTTSSKGSISVTRPFSIMWRIFYSYIFFKKFFLGFWRELSTVLGIDQVIHHFRNLERVIHHFGILSKGYPPV